MRSRWDIHAAQHSTRSSCAWLTQYDPFITQYLYIIRAVKHEQRTCVEFLTGAFQYEFGLVHLFGDVIAVVLEEDGEGNLDM